MKYLKFVYIVVAVSKGVHIVVEVSKGVYIVVAVSKVYIFFSCSI